MELVQDTFMPLTGEHAGEICKLVIVDEFVFAGPNQDGIEVICNIENSLVTTGGEIKSTPEAFSNALVDHCSTESQKELLLDKIGRLKMSEELNDVWFDFCWTNNGR